MYRWGKSGLVAVVIVQSCPFFATPWTVAHQAPLSMKFLQARILDWVAISFSRGSSWHRDWTPISCVLRPSHPQTPCPLITSRWLQNSNLWMLWGWDTDIQATTGWWAWTWESFVSTPTSTMWGGGEAITQQKGCWSQKRPREVVVQANVTGAHDISSFAHIGIWFHLYGMSRRGRCVETKVDLWLPREA